MILEDEGTDDKGVIFASSKKVQRRLKAAIREDYRIRKCSFSFSQGLLLRHAAATNSRADCIWEQRNPLGRDDERAWHAFFFVTTQAKFFFKL